jgi:molybdopterin biosynthesis enzyme
MLRKVALNDAIGMVIGHDMTEVIPGKFKGPAFRRGHIIKKEDIPRLLSMGKEHIYVMELEKGEVHEEEAAIRLANALKGPGIELGEPKEGRVNLKAGVYGLLKINTGLVRKINSSGDILVSTMHNNTVCRPGMMVAGTKIVPLLTDEDKLREIEDLCASGRKAVGINPVKKKKVGIVITGNEVFKGIIEDKFGDVMKTKIENLGSVINRKVIVPDDAAKIAEAIAQEKSAGSELIIVCGGLSVDADDVTVAGVKKSGARIISYGAPVMPGAMFLIARKGGMYILGAPGAVIHNKATVFDIILPRILSDDNITRKDIAELGHGGFCYTCEKCNFPVCPLGK